jgi:hypothetical protein
VNVVPACLRLSGCVLPLFDHFFDARSGSFCQLLLDTCPSTVSTVSLLSGCLFPRLSRVSVHGAWPARARGFLSPGRACRACSTFQVERSVYRVVVGGRLAFQGLPAVARVLHGPPPAMVAFPAVTTLI